MIARSDLDCFYDGPAPEDAVAARACGGFAILARLRARQAGLQCDAAARSILARRRRLQPEGTGRRNADRDRVMAALLASIRAAGLAARRAALPEAGGDT